ncbi:hypothetical protein [Streptomyces sp. NPDC089919]|uniref:DUF7489 domain-containing protein n=1 Tax=Streptomyces sp. NPDC089919 TaxID=3155188 RepID=UPI003446FD3B
MTNSHGTAHGDSWEGTVTDLSRGMLDGSNMYHFVEVRLSDGASLKLRIHRRLWKSLAVGDRLVKHPGSDPAKV